MNDWVSVKSKLPSPYEEVVFYSKETEKAYAGIYSDLYKRGQFIFFENLDGCDFDDEEVTYWMPLPKPPEEK